MTDITHRTVATNGIDMHITEAGEGPVVVLCHGFPELWYSWRHQIPAIAEAGYHVIAPDQRGYGGTTQTAELESYDIKNLGDDILGLLDAVGAEDAVLIGHDWGAPVVWHLAQRAPARVRGVVGMSVPFSRRGDGPPLDVMKMIFTETWFYFLYFQEPGVADADLSRDTATFMRRFLTAIGGESVEAGLAQLSGPRDDRGMVDRLPEPGALPTWLGQADLDYYVAEFTRTGFTGGLNWYRNFNRNWEITPELAGKGLDVPAAFVAGERDPVLAMIPPESMKDSIADLRGITIVPGAGHWIQQERPAEVNAAVLAFLSSLG